MNKRILQLAIPNILSNITVPLLSLTDTAIAGHLESVAYIGAIGLASIIFNFILTPLSFLRMGTSGFTAQAYGRGDWAESTNILLRSLIVSILLSVVILLFKGIIRNFGYGIIESSPEAIKLSIDYYNIFIYSAPAVLIQHSFNGYFIGMQNSKLLMATVITVNLSNILLSLLFVFQLNLGIKGLAAGTLIAQYIGVFTAWFLWSKYFSKFKKYINLKDSIRWNKVVPFFKINSDIYLRTMCLVTVFSFFNYASGKMGETTLAINLLLLQLFYLFSYIMDGFAYAGEALVGRYAGSKDRNNIIEAIKALFKWGGILTIIFVLLYVVGGKSFLTLITDKKEVIQEANKYFYWIIAVPILGFAAFLWDGIFVGLMASKAMRNSMFLATSIFFICYYSLHNIMGNNALWLAFIIYLGSRGIIQTLAAPKILNLKEYAK